MRRNLILSAVAVVVAIAALATAIVALERKASARPRDAQITDLEHRLEALASVTSTSTAAQAAKLSKLTSCMPELVAEINGLTPEISAGSVWLSQHAQISHYCAPVLESSGR